MKVCLMIAAILVCGVSYGGELAPTQKDASQKSAVQKVEATQKSATQKSAVQKGASASVRVGFFGRRAARRCRSGSCG